MQFKEHVYRNHELTSKTIFDRDSMFMSKFCKAILNCQGTKLDGLPPNTHVLSVNRKLLTERSKKGLEPSPKYEKDICDEHLADFEVAYNSSMNSTTLYSPFYIKYRIHSRIIPLQGLSTNSSSAKSFLYAILGATKFVDAPIIKQNTRKAEYTNKSRIPDCFNSDYYIWLSRRNLNLVNGSKILKIKPNFYGPLDQSESARKSKTKVFYSNCLTQ